MNPALDPATCRAATENVGSGVGAALRAVDCAAADMAQSAFARLFGAGGSLSMALTGVLTLFVALIGFGLITGRLRIGLSALTPRMVTLVAVVTFATSWLAFQSVFYNLAVGAPNEIARILMGTQGSATNVFADKIDIVFGALIQVSGPEAMGENTSAFTPPGLMWLGGTLLLLGTVGVLATCKIALAVLMALGPIFIVMALFSGTRGLFVGWLKGVVLLAIVPLFAVLGGSMMLELAVPVIAALGQVPGEIDARSAMAFFMIGAVHAALMVMVVKVAGAMVAGWTVFGLAGEVAADDRRGAGAAQAAAPAAAVAAARTEAARMQAANSTTAASRQIRVNTAAMLPANDTGAAGSRVLRETQIISGGGNQAAALGGTGQSRARGIGSRFRSAPPPAPSGASSGSPAGAAAMRSNPSETLK